MKDVEKTAAAGKVRREKEGMKKSGLPVEKEAKNRPAKRARPALPPLALVGMTGCGKTTVGRLTAKLMGAEFVDLDEILCKESGQSIRELFSLYGEEGFRKLEGECLARQLEKGEGKVISCGGGVILREENRALLRGKALTVWIRRSPRLVLQSKRVLERPPISGDRDRYYALLRQRTPLYKACSSAVLQNRRAKMAAVQLCRIWKKRGRRERGPETLT